MENCNLAAGTSPPSICCIEGVECYEKNGTVFLKLEAVARGLGFTDIKDGAEYVRWARVDKYLAELNFATSGERPSFIPENIFYRLAMKARNEAAERFQAKVADEIIPSIRRTGGYIAGQESMSPAELMATALMVAQKTLSEREARIASLTVQNQILAPKAEYFDELVDRECLTNFRETAKELNISPKAFVSQLLEKKYIFRDKKGKLMPYETRNDGLFQVKECYNEKTSWSGVQTFVTPKGRDIFRRWYQ